MYTSNKIRFGVLAFLLIFFLSACEKEGPISQTAREAGTNAKEPKEETGGEKDVGGGGKELCVCYGYTLEKENGSYDCPKGSGCAKIVPCPCPNGGGISSPFERGNVKSLDRHVQAGEVSSFFENGPWKELFPSLSGKEDTLSGLRNGDLTVIREQNPGEDGIYFYFGVPSSENGDPNPDEVLFTLEVPPEMLE